MGVDKSKTIVPGRGTFFTADRSVAFPANPLEAFSLTGAPPTGWLNIGHTSKQNTAAFARDGGEKTTLDSWIADAIGVIYSATNWALTAAALQIDKDNLDLAFNGAFDTDGGYVIPGANAGREKQIFLLATDGTGKLGFWMENTSVTMGDAPSFDPANFLELPISASILSADPAKIPPVNGVPGIMKLYKSGLVASVPVVSAVAPTSGDTGQLVKVTGSGFTGATAVKFGTNTVPSNAFTVNSDSSISAVIPAASSGSTPVTVVTPAGTSNAVAFAHS